MKKLYVVQFKSGGWNSTQANSKKEALRNLTEKLGEKYISQISSWHEGTEAEELETILMGNFW